MNIKYFGAILFLVVLFSCKRADIVQESTTNKRPNIIFIMADDHGEQAISAYGHEVGKLAPTPNIDRIADEGVLFQNNFCTNSICGPSRAVILTGKFSHLNGFRMNGNRFNGDQPTFPKMLKKSGYNTALIGKWHLYGIPQGFDTWKILDDQGNYYNPTFIMKNDSGKIADTLDVNGYATDLITDMAVDYLEEVKNDENPFLLMVQHKAPHRNWMPALRHLNKYDSVPFPVPDTFFFNCKNSVASQDQLQSIGKDMYEGHDLKMTVEKGSNKLAHNPWKTDFDRMSKEQREIWDKAYKAKNDAFHDLNLSSKELEKWKLQRYLQDYLATIASIDEGVGKILDYLDENDLSKNTLIVYTSDQGFFLGEKGWFDKRFMYEQSFGMPLLMKYPNGINKETFITALTQNLDFAQTFLDYAQVEIPEDMQGKSLRPLLEGTSDQDGFRDAVYYHYYDFPAFHMVKKQYGVRTKRYKLIHFYDDIDTWELYDLKTDPKEIENLIDNESYATIKNQLHSKLDSLQIVYEVSEIEFKQAPKDRIEKAYKQFTRLRGTPIK